MQINSNQIVEKDTPGTNPAVGVPRDLSLEYQEKKLGGSEIGGSETKDADMLGGTYQSASIDPPIAPEIFGLGGQSVRLSEDGKQVIDVTLQAKTVLNASSYEIRIAKKDAGTI